MVSGLEARKVQDLERQVRLQTPLTLSGSAPIRPRIWRIVEENMASAVKREVHLRG